MLSRIFSALRRVVLFPFAALKRGGDFLTFEPENRDVGEILTDAVQQPASVLEHFEALRRHLLRMLFGILIGVIVCGIFTAEIIEWLAWPIGGLDALQAIDPTETVGVFMRVALWGGFSLMVPYLAFELWLFVAPAIGARTRQLSLLAIPLSLIFFLGGMYFSYRFLLPTALPFLLNFMDVRTVPRLSSYINFVTGLLFWMGAAFETPLVIFVLAFMRFVEPGKLLRQWRVAVVGIAVLAAAITPTVDPVNMSLVMLPMLALYFISVLLGYVAVRLRPSQAARG
jgi:sec-independent protein translocase protein TatC